jgi:hypothetical protein
VLVLCAYIPQLVETYRVGGAHSLSYATTFMVRARAAAARLRLSHAPSGPITRLEPVRAMAPQSLP